MKYTIYESGQYKIMKEIEADSIEQAEELFEDWKYGDEIPYEVTLDQTDRSIDD